MRSGGRLIVVLMWLSLPPVTAATTPPTPAHQDDPTLLTAEALRASIGRSVGQPGFNASADLNRDGMVNALDVALFKLAQREGSSPSRTTGAAQAVAGTERISVEPPTIVAWPGQTVSVLFVLRDNTTPLVGYTVDVDIVADPKATGSVTADAIATHFFDVQNLITACPPSVCPTGAIRDPFLSVISDTGDGGVSITTITEDLSTVLAGDGVNDVLAEVFFNVPADALGDFAIQLGSGSTLVGEGAAPVSFAFTPGAIYVRDPATFPAVSAWGMMVMNVVLVAAGCTIFARFRSMS